MCCAGSLPELVRVFSSQMSSSDGQTLNIERLAGAFGLFATRDPADTGAISLLSARRGLA